MSTIKHETEAAHERANYAVAELLMASSYEELEDAFDAYTTNEAQLLGLELWAVPTPLLVAYVEIQRGLIADCALAFLADQRERIAPGWIVSQLQLAADNAYPLITPYLPQITKLARAHNRARLTARQALRSMRS